MYLLECQMQKSLRFGLLIMPEEKTALAKLAEIEGGLSMAAVIRRLIRKAAFQSGIWNLREKTGGDFIESS